MNYLCISTGNLEYMQQVKHMREAFILQPRFFNDALFKSTILKNRQFEDNWLDVVEDLTKNSLDHGNWRKPQQVTVIIDFNCDGVQVKSDDAQSPQMTILLAAMSGLKIDNGVEFTFAHDMPPFIVGFYNGRKKPPRTLIISDFVAEMRSFHPSATNKAPVLLELGRIICDTPATADLRNTVGHAGYYAPPRCIQRGVKRRVAGETNKYGPMTFPEMNCLQNPRLDEDWIRYKVHAIVSLILILE